MAHRICPKCQKKNAVGNRNCVGCGRLIYYDPILKDNQKPNIFRFGLTKLSNSLFIVITLASLAFLLLTVFDANQAQMLLDSLRQ